MQSKNFVLLLLRVLMDTQHVEDIRLLKACSLTGTYYPENLPERTPIKSTFYPVVNRYSGISTVYRRLFVCGGQITKINLSTGSRSGESEPVLGVFFPHISDLSS
jgi:hypothetical protein